MSEPRRRPLRVLSFESRRAAEMRSLIERRGGVATVVPSMREVPLEENEAALEFARRLLDGQIDRVVFLTGVGARALLEAVETAYDREEFLSALDRCEIAVRGPKPTSVLREWGVHIDCRAPEPNTWRELLAAMEEELAPLTGKGLATAGPRLAPSAQEEELAPLRGKRVAVQEYGEPNDEFYSELRSRGAEVLPVPVYRWAFPEETGPLIEAVGATIEGRFDAVLFTSAFQLTSVLHAAEQAGCRREWIEAANRCLVASIGPTASEALRKAGLSVGVEASPPKMGQLVRAVFEDGGEVLAR